MQTSLNTSQEQKGKTPGPDGVEKELMSRFWSMIGQTIADATEEYIQNQKLNSFLERGIIKVILKGGTDGSELKMWRPITLLSQIYKLISGVIAGRMKKLLSKLISPSQKAYQNTANIGEIVLDILETIAINNHHKNPGIILLVDFSKAFDSISHKFIYEALEFFNFGNYFISVIKTMLNNRSCTIMIDGFETQQFKVERGVPQGDTASPYLFILVLEVLLLKIQLDPNLERIKLEVRNYKPEDGGNLNIPILQVFADDMTVVIKETVENLICIRDIFKDFSDISGLEINEGKTKIIRFGTKLEDVNPITDKVKFIYTTTFKLLGVDIVYQLLKLQDNFIKRQKKINQKIFLWRKYNLSTIGNLIISKTF